jgi:hypothetical protein
MQLVTSQCRRYGHAEFCLQADDSVPGEYLQHAAQTVEQMVARGSQFRPGQTFQIGWMWTQVMQHDATYLTLHEPDMRSMPIQWVPGITETLRTMMIQLFTLDSVSLRGQMDAPHVRQFVLACNRFHEPEFRMIRMPAEEAADSGWFLSCADDRHDHQRQANIVTLSVYEAWLSQRYIQGFVAFPVGSMISMDRHSGLQISLHDRPLRIVPGSYLDQLLRR